MIGAIVLAAGRSVRMGTQKLLLPIADRPLITRVVDELLRSPVDEIVVIIGADGAQIEEALSGRRVRLTTNLNSEGDMLSSVRCGLRALPPSCEAVLVTPGDQPGLTAGLVAKLVTAFRASGRGIAVPVHGGRRGHPLLFGAAYREEALRGFEGVGLRGLLAAHPGDITEVAVEVAAELDDVDTPADYRRLLGSSAAPASKPSE